MKATALYHQPPHLQDCELFVEKENSDGTVDLHDKDGKAIVTSCPVADKPTPGQCTICGPSKAEPKASSAKSNAKK